MLHKYKAQYGMMAVEYTEIEQQYLGQCNTLWENSRGIHRCMQHGGTYMQVARYTNMQCDNTLETEYKTFLLGLVPTYRM